MEARYIISLGAFTFWKDGYAIALGDTGATGFEKSLRTLLHRHEIGKTKNAVNKRIVPNLTPSNNEYLRGKSHETQRVEYRLMIAYYDGRTVESFVFGVKNRGANARYVVNVETEKATHLPVKKEFTLGRLAANFEEINAQA